NQHPRPHLVRRGHVRLLPKGRNLGHRSAVETVILFLERGALAMKSNEAHAVRKPAGRVGLNVVRDQLRGDVTLELESKVRSQLAASYLRPSVFDDGSRLHGRHGKGFGFDLES